MHTFIHSRTHTLSRAHTHTAAFPPSQTCLVLIPTEGFEPSSAEAQRILSAPPWTTRASWRRTVCGFAVETVAFWIGCEREGGVQYGNDGAVGREGQWASNGRIERQGVGKGTERNGLGAEERKGSEGKGGILEWGGERRGSGDFG